MRATMHDRHRHLAAGSQPGFCRCRTPLCGHRSLTPDVFIFANHAPIPDKKDIYAEAKGQGFDVKIVREVIRIRKQDQNELDEHATLLDVYLHALATAPPLAKAA